MRGQLSVTLDRQRVGADLYGHLIDRNLLWEAAQKVVGTTGASAATEGNGKAPDSGEKGA